MNEEVFAVVENGTVEVVVDQPPAITVEVAAQSDVIVNVEAPPEITIQIEQETEIEGVIND